MWMGNKSGVYHRAVQWGIEGGTQGLGILVRWDTIRQEVSVQCQEVAAVRTMRH